MSKREKRRKTEPESDADDELPFGYLETADPPRKNVALLIASVAALVLWMGALIYLSMWGS